MMFENKIRQLNNELRQIKTAQAVLAEQIRAYKSNTVSFSIPTMSASDKQPHTKFIRVNANIPLLICDPILKFDINDVDYRPSVLPWADGNKIGFRISEPVYVGNVVNHNFSFCVIANQEVTISVE